MYKYNLLGISSNHKSRTSLLSLLCAPRPYVFFFFFSFFFFFFLFSKSNPPSPHLNYCPVIDVKLCRKSYIFLSLSLPHYSPLHLSIDLPSLLVLFFSFFHVKRPARVLISLQGDVTRTLCLAECGIH